MKRIIQLSLIAIITAIFAPLVNGQAFPQIWERNKYDFSEGVNGRLHIINYSGSTSPNPDKAYIFATAVKEGNVAVTRDLFRLTLAGESTFNSPFSGYPATVAFAEQSIVEGKITTTASGLRMWGVATLSLGVRNAQNLVEISDPQTAFSNEVQFRNQTDNLKLQMGRIPSKQYVCLTSATDTPIAIGSHNYPGLIVDATSNVFVGMTTDQYERVPAQLKTKYNLFVKEGILSEDYSIAPIASWADFVFSPTYRLKPLSEVETYIKDNGHLEGVPSEEEVAQNGYSQHELNKALLQKIEELTLYVIQQQKEIEELKSQINK